MGSAEPDDLDRLIHERIRLGIVSALAAEECLSFGDLKTILKTSDGNLSVHARKLEGAGYIAVKKGYEDRKPKTEYRLIDAKGKNELIVGPASKMSLRSRVRLALPESSRLHPKW